MTTPGPRFSTLALRLLVVLPVLAGVLVMHGLTSDHDIAMATMAGAGAHSPVTSMSSPHAAGHANQGTPGPDGMAARKEPQGACRRHPSSSPPYGGTWTSSAQAPRAGSS